ncbi:unnamed protein product [Arctogadus glacialis]
MLQAGATGIKKRKKDSQQLEVKHFLKAFLCTGLPFSTPVMTAATTTRVPGSRPSYLSWRPEPCRVCVDTGSRCSRGQNPLWNLFASQTPTDDPRPKPCWMRLAQVGLHQSYMNDYKERHQTTADDQERGRLTGQTAGFVGAVGVPFRAVSGNRGERTLFWRESQSDPAVRGTYKSPRGGSETAARPLLQPSPSKPQRLCLWDEGRSAGLLSQADVYLIKASYPRDDGKEDDNP